MTAQPSAIPLDCPWLGRQGRTVALKSETNLGERLLQQSFGKGGCVSVT